ncbi:sugar ABC transporter periplasmic protein [Bradyrhizobium oligotrophicum S58]|uniref:Sugar ABC transporter periplasmic protein n=1 Tax=Bradyrhizobium oligotrophicum S58 TaxID=1245469 RepID=M4ZVH2_9BRAD|nr:sugar ABC transporter periplasmic protein [Bradyrhizobium oligotrophicum S58]
MVDHHCSKYEGRYGTKQRDAPLGLVLLGVDLDEPPNQHMQEIGLISLASEPHSGGKLPQQSRAEQLLQVLLADVRKERQALQLGEFVGAQAKLQH